jgi:uncharacterized protein related to proFAR isomerase
MNMNTTPNQDTLQAIKDSTVETVTIEIAGEYADIHPVAQALALGDNASEILKDLIESSRCCYMARVEIVEIWEDMASLGKLATIRTLLNRQSKAVLKYALTVKDGQLLAAQTRVKPSKTTAETAETAETSAEHLAQDDDLTRVKRWFISADDEKRAKVLALIAKLG